MSYRKYFFIVLLALCQAVYGQQKADTAALVKEFYRVMNFSVQPYVYYTTFSTMESDPVLEQKDTISMQGEFYKNQTDMYYRNGPDEVYLQDSLLIQVNNDRKTIWVSRVDMASKSKLNSLPMGSKQLLEIMRKQYTMQQTMMGGGMARVSLETKQLAGRSTVVTSTMNLDYTVADHLPRAMNIEMRMLQPADDEMVEQIKSQGVDETKLIQVIDGKRYLVRRQKVNTAFTNINNTAEKAGQMPSWKNMLLFNSADQSFSAQGSVAAYEVTKTF